MRPKSRCEYRPTSQRGPGRTWVTLNPCCCLKASEITLRVSPYLPAGLGKTRSLSHSWLDHWCSQNFAECLDLSLSGAQTLTESLPTSCGTFRDGKRKPHRGRLPPNTHSTQNFIPRRSMNSRTELRPLIKMRSWNTNRAQDEKSSKTRSLNSTPHNSGRTSTSTGGFDRSKHSHQTIRAPHRKRHYQAILFVLLVLVCRVRIPKQPSAFKQTSAPNTAHPR